MKSIDDKNKKLQFLDSPYYVQNSEKVKTAIDYALEKGLLKKYKINYSNLDNFLNREKELPLWIIEAVCKLNLEDNTIPAQYQNLWFCLHNTFLKRKQPSGREFKTKVNFSSCYVKSNKKIRNLLYKACTKMNLPLYKFSWLCGYKKTLSNNKVIPLIALLKICQILKINMWKLLKGYELFGKTSKKGKIIIPKEDVDLFIILIWLKTEGHIELGSTHIEINQKQAINTLKRLRALFINKFALKNINLNFPKGKEGEDRLIISSSPLKQFLCLKYNIPPGYKSNSLLSTKFGVLSKEDYKKILPSFIETEGCLSSHYTRNKKRKLPRFEFSVKDSSLAKDCLFVLEKIGFEPKFSERQNIFKIGLYNSKKVVDLLNQTEKYFFDKKKLIYLKEVCSGEIGL